MKAEHRSKLGEKYAAKHNGSASEKRLGCAHEELFAWGTMGSDIAVLVVESNGDIVSAIIV